MPPNGLTPFLADEDGAVSSDFVVLCGLVVGMCIAIYTTLGDGAFEHGDLAGEAMKTRGIPTYGLERTTEN